MRADLNPLQLADKKLFERFLRCREHELAVYSFASIYNWTPLYDIRWTLIDGSLCVFFKDSLGCFLYLPPLGREATPRIVEKAFSIMDRFNRNKTVSRIENVEEPALERLRSFGLESVFKSYDYLYTRSSLAQLKGDAFKSKRASVNYFTRQYRFVYQRLRRQQAAACLALYRSWMDQRSRQTPDHVYCGMLQDTLKTLETVFAHYDALDIEGRVVTVDRQVKAFTCGYKLNPDIFCILYEVADLSVKGLSQFIFQRFSRDLGEHAFINAMDDSGLENLKKVKLSYRPVRLVPSYIVQRRKDSSDAPRH
ncbi:MAG TPA: phosphatidylglycerol lysyltransferase domain-containing protein [Candidatus Omnitrophota bacterium]|nr:phosphatidylglycerol lysyltransferase domain-containing protein [Candidatus Omnitrophota bacterium]